MQWQVLPGLWFWGGGVHRTELEAWAGVFPGLTRLLKRLRLAGASEIVPERPHLLGLRSFPFPSVLRTPSVPALARKGPREQCRPALLAQDLPCSHQRLCRPVSGNRFLQDKVGTGTRMARSGSGLCSGQPCELHLSPEEESGQNWSPLRNTSAGLTVPLTAALPRPGVPAASPGHTSATAAASRSSALTWKPLVSPLSLPESVLVGGLGSSY